MRRRNRAWVLAGLLALTGAGVARAEQAPEYTRTPDVIYGRKAGLALTMDVFAPKQGANGLGVLYVVSGGWFSHPGRIHPAFYHELLRRGYTVFAVVHGSQPKFTIPEILDDLHRAVRFVRYHAGDYHIDAEHLGIVGSSAGGHLALMQGTAGRRGDPKAKDPVERVSSRVQAVAAFFPPTDFLNFGAPGRELNMRTVQAPFTGAVDFKEFDRFKAVYVPVTDEKKVREIVRQISPVTHVSHDDAPALLIHGDSDPLVPLQQSEVMLARLREARVPSRLVVKKNAGHGWFSLADDMKLCADWFDEHLAHLDRPTAE